MPQTKTIHCLSVRQPYASWIVYDSKWCENRTWSTKHRGPLYIHASSWEPGIHVENRRPENYCFPVPTGSIIGCVDLLGCWPLSDVEDAAMMVPQDDPALSESLVRLSGDPLNFFGWQAIEGPVCWLMADRKPLAEPIEMAGKLRIWKTEVTQDQLRLGSIG